MVDVGEALGQEWGEGKENGAGTNEPRDHCLKGARRKCQKQGAARYRPEQARREDGPKEGELATKLLLVAPTTADVARHDADRRRDVGREGRVKILLQGASTAFWVVQKIIL